MIAKTLSGKQDTREFQNSRLGYYGGPYGDAVIAEDEKVRAADISSEKQLEGASSGGDGSPDGIAVPATNSIGVHSKLISYRKQDAREFLRRAVLRKKGEEKTKEICARCHGNDRDL